MPALNLMQSDLAIHNDLIAAVERHGDGIDAISLGKELEASGYQQYSVQRAIRHALDKGLIELGSKLRLRRRLTF